MRTRYDRRALRRLRRAKQMTVEVLAQRSSTSRQAVSFIDRGVVEPKASTIARLATALEVGPEAFFKEVA